VRKSVSSRCLRGQERVLEVWLPFKDSVTVWRAKLVLPLMVTLVSVWGSGSYGEQWRSCVFEGLRHVLFSICSRKTRS
ncbi:hypothetical protein CEXT_735841, partial [Caerostris extrusa]